MLFFWDCDKIKLLAYLFCEMLRNKLASQILFQAPLGTKNL